MCGYSVPPAACSFELCNRRKLAKHGDDVNPIGGVAIRRILAGLRFGGDGAQSKRVRLLIAKPVRIVVMTGCRTTRRTAPGLTRRGTAAYVVTPDVIGAKILLRPALSLYPLFTQRSRPRACVGFPIRVGSHASPFAGFFYGTISGRMADHLGSAYHFGAGWYLPPSRCPPAFCSTVPGCGGSAQRGGRGTPPPTRSEGYDKITKQARRCRNPVMLNAYVQFRQTDTRSGSHDEL